ncbi:MAG: hypothetical protein U5L06_01060 [Rhodovibrio sp.]|nr:hypothetical protein [Rhodovibrio sp.]
MTLEHVSSSGALAYKDADIMDEVSDGHADAKAALLLIQVLILSLLEARVVDGEVLRRIADDALTERDRRRPRRDDADRPAPEPGHTG